MEIFSIIYIFFGYFCKIFNNFGDIYLYKLCLMVFTMKIEIIQWLGKISVMLRDSMLNC